MIEPDPVIEDTESIPPDADTVEEEDADTTRPDTGPEPVPESPDSDPVPEEDPEAETAAGTEP